MPSKHRFTGNGRISINAGKKVSALLTPATSQPLAKRGSLDILQCYQFSAKHPKLWEASGLPYPKLIDALIELALERHREMTRTKYSIELPAGSGGALES